jgi:hypothetical protein
MTVRVTETTSPDVVRADGQSLTVRITELLDSPTVTVIQDAITVRVTESSAEPEAFVVIEGVARTVRVTETMQPESLPTVKTVRFYESIYVGPPGPQGEVGPQGPAGPQNLFVQATDPGMTSPGLWIQTGPGGEISFWVEDGA